MMRWLLLLYCAHCKMSCKKPGMCTIQIRTNQSHTFIVKSLGTVPHHLSRLSGLFKPLYFSSQALARSLGRTAAERGLSPDVLQQ